MNLSEVFLKRPIMTILIMMTILFFGILCYRSLPVNDLPNVDYPTIQVSVDYPGANPELMANSVVTPLEKQFTAMPSTSVITSQSYTGTATIVIQFDLDRDIDLAATDVQEAINAASSQLPKDLPYQPTYTKVNPAATPILFLAISSATMPLGELYDYANNVIGEQLNLVEGVAQVTIYGSPFAVRARVDPQLLAAKNIGVDQVADSLKGHNIYIPVGTLYGKKNELIIDVHGQIEHAEGYDPLIIKNEGSGAITRFRDVGYAVDSLSDDKYYMHFQTKDIDEPAVILAIQKQGGANALNVIKGINEKLPSLEKQLPGSVRLYRVFDKSIFIKQSVDDVKLTVIVAFILVAAIILFYLGRVVDTLIPILALPMSILGACIVMSFCGFSIDILSLLAISLSIGFLVDDAIVVLENIFRHIEMGSSPYKAALDGSKEICFTILSMTLCLVSVFIPMLFMGGIVGRVFKEFAVVIVSTVIISGFISLSLTPMICSRILHPKGDLTKLEKFSERVNEALKTRYEKSLHWIMGHRAVVILGGVVCLIASALLFQILPKELFPTDDMGFVQGVTQASDGTSTFEMDNYQKALSDILRKKHEVESMVSIGANPTDSQGFLFIGLKPFGERPSILEVIKKFYGELYMVPGVRTFLKAPPLIDLQVGTSAVTGDYQYTLQSLNTVDLYPAAVKLFQKLKQTPGFSQVYSDLQVNQPLLKIEILRDRASMLNIDASDIENTLNLAYAGSNLSPIKEPTNLYYVIMETEPKFYRDPWGLSQLYIRSSTHGNLVPITEITRMTQTVGPLAVNHINSMPSVTFSFNLVGIPLSTGLKQLEKLSKDTLPPTVTGTLQGTANVFQESFSSMGALMIITFFVIYVILGILYEDFFHPITVMTTLPPAAVGGFLVLLITNSILSMYAFVGVILLLGIVLKNGIIMIDFANEAVQGGMDPKEAIFKAAVTRFRPILMTTISAIMGAVPIAIGIGGETAQSRRPLGLVIIGGLVFSQVLTLYLTPVTYIYIEKFKTKIMHRFKVEDGTPQKPHLNDAG